MQRRSKPGQKSVVNERQLAQVFRQKSRAILSSSVLTSRAALSSKLGKSFGGKRDLYTALGYPGLDELRYENYYQCYRRQDIANRLIDAPVIGSWEQKPYITIDKDKESPFVEKWNALVKKTRLWHTLIRADKLARLGRFGCILLGFNDVRNKEDLKKPVKIGERQLLYLQPFGEGKVEISKWYKDLTNPKYNQPELYKIEQRTEDSGNGISVQALEVHESRIIHIVENQLESAFYGLPELEKVYNRLLNIETIVGGSAEMFWQGAFPGYAFVADDDADMSQTATELEAEIDLFVHDFKRYMKLQGLTVQKLSSDVASPSAHVDAQILMVSIASGIPIRILTGSERGSLASSQDEGHWNDKLSSRRIDFIEPIILRPLIDKLIEYKVLPQPSGDYTFNWPDLNTPTDKDKAEIGKTRAEAIKLYASTPEINYLMSFRDFLLEILKLDEPTVEKIVDGSAQALQDALDREAEAGMTDDLEDDLGVEDDVTDDIE